MAGYKPLRPNPGTAPEPNSFFPYPYTATIDPQGYLVIKKAGEMVFRADDYGFELHAGITTGVGSYNLGESHSMGTAGENVIWRNKITDDVYFPPWSNMPDTGAVDLGPTTRIHAEETNQNDGANSASTTADYGTLNKTNVAYTQLKFKLNEALAGQVVYWKIANQTTGVKVTDGYEPVSKNPGQIVQIHLPHPIWQRTESLKVEFRLGDENGAPIKAYSKDSDPTQYYLEYIYRDFVDYPLYHAGDIQKVQQDVVQPLLGGYLPILDNMIVQWYGDAALVPAGWQIADGTNGTPNINDPAQVQPGTVTVLTLMYVG